MTAIYCRGGNVGDMMTEAILRSLGHEPEHVMEGPALVLCGSISHLCGPGTVALGTGSFAGCGPRGGSAGFVRGPATARLWGDTGLMQCEAGLMLAPLMNVRADPKAKAVGVIWHYADADMAPPLPVGCIGISTALAPEDFVRAVAGCRLILSSSLHGIVCADSMGIPCIRLKQLSGEIRDFDYKHADYYNGTGRDLMPAHSLSRALSARPWTWHGCEQVMAAIAITSATVRSRA